jgi:hypothetical protein
MAQEKVAAYFNIISQMCLEEFKKTKDPQSGELILDRQS